MRLGAVPGSAARPSCHDGLQDCGVGGGWMVSVGELQLHSESDFYHSFFPPKAAANDRRCGG